MKTLTLTWACEGQNICLKLTYGANGQPVLEAWDALWLACRESVPVESDQAGRDLVAQLLAERRAFLFWDTTLEAQASAEPSPAAETAEQPVTLRTLVDFLASASREYHSTGLAIDFLTGELGIGNLAGAMNYANKEVWRARRMEDCELKTEYLTMLNGFLRLAKQLG